jgi:hypothetical protein
MAVRGNFVWFKPRSYDKSGKLGATSEGSNSKRERIKSN